MRRQSDDTRYLAWREVGMAHVTAARLAAMWRSGEEFPAHAEERAAAGWPKVLARGNYEAIPFPGRAYVRFRCKDCCSSLIVANTWRGIRHAARVSLSHPGECCKVRQEAYRLHRQETAWPDEEDA